MRERPLERVDGQATFALGSRSRYPAQRDEREVRTERRGDKRRLQLHRLPYFPSRTVIKRLVFSSEPWQGARQEKSQTSRGAMTQTEPRRATDMS